MDEWVDVYFSFCGVSSNYLEAWFYSYLVFFCNEQFV